MLKISGIIPNSARVASVDLKDAHPVRPGVPSFGRPVGRSQSQGQIRKSSMAFPLQDMRTQKEYEHSKIVNDLSNSFFMRRSTPEPVVSVKPTVSQEMGMIALEQDNDFDQLSYEGEEEDQPEYIRNGQYLDVAV